MDPSWIGVEPGNPGETQLDLDRAKSGDEESFARLWMRFEPLLGVFLKTQLRRRIEAALRARFDDAIEDLIQETSIIVFTRFKDFESRHPGAFYFWIIKIAENLFFEWMGYWNRNCRHPRLEVAIDDHKTRSFVSNVKKYTALRDTATGPGTAVAKAEERERLLQALSGLEERYHSIVTLKFMMGLTWAEVANAVGGVSGDAVKMEYVNKILPKLREGLAAGE